MARGEQRKVNPTLPARGKARGGVVRAGSARGGAALAVRAGAPRGGARAGAARVPAKSPARGASAAKAGASRGAAASAAKVSASRASSTSAAATARAGATLRAAATATVRQKAAPGRVRSVALWNAFWTGNWFLVDHFDADGRRFLVARRYGRNGRQGLSSRQWQVAVLVAGGYANKQIAHELGLAESTVATYLAQAMAKLGVRSRMELPRLLPLERRRGVR